MEGLFSEHNGLKQAAQPKDINASAMTGARIAMKPGYKLAIVVSVNNGAGAVTLDLDQHDAPTSGNSKALSISNPYFTKVGAETKFTKVEVSSPADSYALTGLTGAAGVVVFEVLQEDLDVDNGYAYVSANIAAAAAAKITHLEYIIHNAQKKPVYNIDL
jgi:hypothetical protein